MRICIYTETALPMLGGHEIVVDSLARQYLAAGHQTVVLAPTPRSAWRKAGWRDADQLFPYPMERHPRFISTRRLIGLYGHWLKRVQKTYAFDVLHCQSTYPTGYLGTRLARGFGIPVAITAHGADVTPTSSKLSEDRVRRRHVEAILNADARIAISDFIADSYRRIVPDCDVVRIPNGVDTAEFFRVASRPDGLQAGIQPGRYVLFLGRLARRKGVDLLIDALARIPREERPLLVIAGEGEERPALERSVAEFGLRDSILFVGAAEGSRKIYLLQNSLVNVLPSRQWEGFPLVVLESFAAGRPLIAARVPGLATAVRHGETGWVVEPESPEALAEAIRVALADAPLRERLGRQARAQAENYDWKIIARSYLELFERLVAEKKQGRTSETGRPDETL